MASYDPSGPGEGARKTTVLKPQAEASTPYVLRLEQTVAELERERTSLRGYTRKLKEAVADRQRRIKALEAEKANLISTNEALLKSTSWRLTLPVRIAAEACFAFGRAARRAVVGPVELATPPNPDVEAFERDGFIAPVDLFTRAQCDLILKHHRLGNTQGRRESKARGADDRFFYDVATRPQLLERLKLLLGNDIVWWGMRVIRREPGQAHVWHTDIESSAPEGRFVSVWVGLEGTCQESALQLITGSHRFGKPIQQEMHERSVKRGDVTNDMAAGWARELHPPAKLVQPEMHDGQSIIFDGRLWHASHNVGQWSRSALLLQYAAANIPIALPDRDHLEWPFRFSSEEPSRVLVSGTSETKTSPPPPACPRQYQEPVKTNVHLGDGFLPSQEGWKPYKLFRGPTPILDIMKAHVSVLNPGHCPHPPHCHVEEELLIVLDGEAEIVLPKGPSPEGARVERLLPGGFGYYPAYQYHTIRNVSAAPVTYLMFKWQGAPVEVEEPLPALVMDMGVKAEANEQPRSMRVLFQGPTSYLGKLHAHVTDLQPGAGYEPHADKYDVAILVFSGRIETLGQAIGPGGSIWYSAGESHGMLNVGPEPARYLVLEFHAGKSA